MNETITWISCFERDHLPIKNTDVLVQYKRGGFVDVAVAYYDDNLNLSCFRFSDSAIIFNPIYWAKMPEGPK